jgi:DNA repair protein RecO (recombination protein O)
VRFELAILDDLGFGLDLTRCAATGSNEDLAWVSPRTGRAVGRQAGQPWADKLLVLPEFLSPGARLAADRESMEQAFRLTGYFFERHVYEPRGITMPDSRSGFVQAALKSLAAGNTTG